MDLTVRDAARLLHASENAVYRWIHEGTLPSYRVNDRYRLNRVELLEWATERNLKVSPEIFQGEDSGVRIQKSEGVSAESVGILTQAMREGGVVYDLPGTDKASALSAICEALGLPEGLDRKDVYGVLLAREALGSTAIGNGIAIPHPRSPLILGVKTPSVTLAFLKQPVDFGALDGRPVDTLLTIISTTIRVHLQLLSHLMAALRDREFAHELEARASREQLLATLARVEAGFAAIARLGMSTANGERVGATA